MESCKRSQSKYRKRIAMVLMTVLLAISFCVPVKASEKTSRVLRVAFPQVQGISETAGDGTRYGLVVDYLNEIAKYTNWE